MLINSKPCDYDDQDESSTWDDICETFCNEQWINAVDFNRWYEYWQGCCNDG